MIEKLKKILKNRTKIIEGFKNYIFKDEDIEEIAQIRMDICKTNACGYYDPEGKSPEAVVPGIPSCGACGCSLEVKTRCMSCKCGLTEVGKEPLWKEVQ